MSLSWGSGSSSRSHCVCEAGLVWSSFKTPSGPELSRLHLVLSSLKTPSGPELSQDSKAVLTLDTASAHALTSWHSCMLYSTLCAPLSSVTAQSILSSKTPTRLQPSPLPSSLCFPPMAPPPPELGCGKRLVPSAAAFGARGLAKHWFCGAMFVEETST